MTRPPVAVLDYGIGNLRSAQKALERVGADAALTADPDVVRRAAGVVLPGVGNYGRCRAALRETGLDAVARDAVASGRPFLGICVGLQLLCARSEESPAEPGLGVFDVPVERLPAGVKLPQMQWNRVVVRRPNAMLGGGHGARDRGDSGDSGDRRDADGPGGGPWFYFVHSYAPADGPDTVAVCDYGGEVVAAVARDNVWATQFHPEKSGTEGLALLGRFVAACGG